MTFEEVKKLNNLVAEFEGLEKTKKGIEDLPPENLMVHLRQITGLNGAEYGPAKIKSIKEIKKILIDDINNRMAEIKWSIDNSEYTPFRES